MKRKITIRLSEPVARGLEAAATLLGSRKSAIVESALDRLLDPQGGASAVARQLERVGRRLDAMEYDLRIVCETVALHARYHLTVTPPLPLARQHEACALGKSRFDELAAQVARRVNMNTPLMKQVIDRLIATTPNLFLDGVEQQVALRTTEDV
jgi:predicted transcriptional regulator